MLMKKPAIPTPKPERKLLALKKTDPFHSFTANKTLEGSVMPVRRSASESSLSDMKMGSSRSLAFESLKISGPRVDHTDDPENDREDAEEYSSEGEEFEFYPLLERDRFAFLKKKHLLFEDVGYDVEVEAASLSEETPEPLSGRQDWIPPSAPLSSKGKENPQNPNRLSPLHDSEGYIITMQWLPTAAKLFHEKHCRVQSKNDNPQPKRFGVCFLHPLKQNCDFKESPGPESVKKLFEQNGIYEEMILLWPSVVEDELEFWSETYLTHGSKSVFSPVDYFKAGLEAANFLVEGDYLSRLDCGGSYTEYEVLDAFSGFLCEINVVKHDQDFFISDIRVPLDFDLKPIPGNARTIPLIPVGTLVHFALF